LKVEELDKIGTRLFQIACEHIFNKEDVLSIRISSNCIYLLGQIGTIEGTDIDKTKRLIRALKELAPERSYSYIGALYALTELGDSQSIIELQNQHKDEFILKRDVDFHLIYFCAYPPQQSVFPPNIPLEEGVDCSRLFDGLERNLKRKKRHERINVYCELICYSLLTYHRKHSTDDALKWINKFECTLSEISSDYGDSDQIKNCIRLFESTKKEIEHT
jgi:hypothetical protein